MTDWLDWRNITGKQAAQLAKPFVASVSPVPKQENPNIGFSYHFVKPRHPVLNQQSPSRQNSRPSGKLRRSYLF
jgi:hypothetical protein